MKKSIQNHSAAWSGCDQEIANINLQSEVEIIVSQNYLSQISRSRRILFYFMIYSSILFILKTKEGRNGSNSCTWDFRRPIYEELKQGSPPPLPPSRHYRPPDYYRSHAGSTVASVLCFLMVVDYDFIGLFNIVILRDW